MMRGAKALVAVWLAVLVGAGPAAATVTQTTATVAAANGGDPQVALDDNGFAQVAYSISPSADDTIHACQLPPSATTCAHDNVLGTGYDPAAMVPDSTSPADADVVFNARGTGFDDPDGDEAVAASTDEGASYGAPVLAGHGVVLPTETVPGPGTFSYSSLSFDNFVSGPLDGSSSPGGATFAPSGTDDLESPMGIGFPDPTTPLNVWEHTHVSEDGSTSTTTIGYRRWTDTGSINDPSTWTPFMDYTPPDGVLNAGTSDVATGPKGVFALYDPKTPGSSICGTVPEVIRYDPVANAWGAPSPIDANPHAGLTGCAFGNGITVPMIISEDGAGVLHVVYYFTSNLPGADNSPPQGYLYTVSFDGGKTFATPISLASPDEQLDSMHIATNDSGQGVLAYTTSNGDSTGDAIHAMWLPPLSAFATKSVGGGSGGSGSGSGGGGSGGGGGGGSSDCVSQIAVGPIKALATQGCWTLTKKVYSETGPVKLNGIDMIPVGGSTARAHAAAAGTLSISTTSRAITSDGQWTIKAGSASFGSNPVNWKVAAAGGKLLSAAGSPVMLPVAPGQTLLGLPVGGTVTPSFSAGTSSLPVNLQLPDPLSGIAGDALTSDLTLTADNQNGVRTSLGSIQLDLPEVDLGPAKIDPFKITYDADPFVFEGDLGVALPGGANLHGHLLIRNGDLVDLSASFKPFDPGIPIATGVFLTKVGFNLHKGETCKPADQTNFGLSASIVGGPDVAGVALLGIDGSATYYLPKGACGLPARFRIQGTGRIVGLPVASVYLEVDTPPAKITFGAGVALGDPSVASVSANIDGGIEPSRGEFFIEGKAQVFVLKYKVASVDVIGSNIGLGACATLSPLGPLLTINAGAAYTWDDNHLDIMPDDCDVSFLKPKDFAARAAGGPSVVPVARGTGSETFLVFGSQHAPSFTLSGPTGAAITPPSAEQEVVKTARYTAITLDGLHETAVTVRKPAAGDWTITPEGTEPITEVRSASSVTLPQVRGRVRKLRGGKFALSYHLRGNTGGMVVNAIQKAPDGSSQVIGALKPGHGTLIFAAAQGAAGRRQVLLVAHAVNGISTRAPLIATFVAPRPVGPAKPRDVKLARRAGGVRVTWKTAPGAAKYVVRATLYDGRQVEFPRSAGQRSLSLANVPAADYGSILVYAVEPDGQLSKPATVKLKRLVVKKHHKKKKHGSKHKKH